MVSNETIEALDPPAMGGEAVAGLGDHPLVADDVQYLAAIHH